MQPLPRHSLTDLVTEQLFQRLVSGILLPGDRLAEIQLAEELNVSRTPVREALLRLATLGLLEKDTHRGARVASPSLAELVEVYEVREALEGMAARLFALRATVEQQAALQQTWHEIEAARAGGDALTVRIRDFELHRQIIHGGNNEYLGGAGHAEALMLLAYLVREHGEAAPPPPSPRASDPHVAVMAALQARDAEAAEAAMRAHVRSSREDMVARLAPADRDRLYPPLSSAEV